MDGRNCKKERSMSNLKRPTLPRSVKEQSARNLDDVAVIMEIIKASSDVEEINFEKAKKLPKKQRRAKNINKNINLNIIETVHFINKNKSLGNTRNLNKTSQIMPCCESNRSINMMDTKKQALLNSSGLSHFMEFGERTDLLNDSTEADPLGPDSIDSFQWVDVKEEPPDIVEVGNVTLTELPLSSCSPIGIPPSSPGSIITDTPPREPEPPENDSADQDNSCNDISLDSQESENIEVHFKKMKKQLEECNLCGKELSSKRSLRLHKVKKHQEKKLYVCDLCDNKFESQRQVIEHRNSVHREGDGKFCCQVCSKRFADYHSLLPHIQKHLNNCKEEEGSDKACGECQKTFQNDESLRIHEVLTHTIDEKGLREKLKNQGKNFICDTCGKRFAFNCLLQDHMNLHTGTKPYLCQRCGKCFFQQATLKQHFKTHSDIRPHQCPQCPQGFYGAGDLKKHLRKHTGERPYTCEVCGEHFSRGTHLIIHRRSHTGERPYTCDVCSRGFTKRGDVVRHRRIHTGELPYLCETCGKAFRQSSQCVNHIKSQHPEVPVIVARNPNLYLVNM